MDDLINALEQFIEKKIAAEIQIIKDGYVSTDTQVQLQFSRNDLLAALRAQEAKNDDE